MFVSISLESYFPPYMPKLSDLSFFFLFFGMVLMFMFSLNMQGVFEKCRKQRSAFQIQKATPLLEVLGSAVVYCSLAVVFLIQSNNIWKMHFGMLFPSYTSGCTEKISYTDLHSLSVCIYQHKIVFCRVGVGERILAAIPHSWNFTAPSRGQF